MKAKGKEKLSARDRAKLRSHGFGSPARSWAVGAVIVVMLVVGTAVLAWVLGRMTSRPDAAPKFSLPSSIGRVVSLDEFVGQHEVVLIFYMVHS
jgi:hypothetical protein